MSDYDLRSLTDDEFDEFETEFDLDAVGQELDEEGNIVVEEPGPVTKIISSMTAFQRMVLMAMLFLNVLILGLGLLIATGRLG